MSFNTKPSTYEALPVGFFTGSTNGATTTVGRATDNGQKIITGIPLVESAVAGSRGFLSGSGRILSGPYAGDTLLGWALKYAAHGLYVFQMRDGGKDFYGNCPRCNPSSSLFEPDRHAQGSRSCQVHPAGYERCHGLYAATLNRDIIRTWWTEKPHSNIGINCGWSGIALIDTDITKGKTGDQALAELVTVHGELPPAPTARTASGGGHLLFDIPGGMDLRSSAGSDDMMTGLAHGVDIKANGGLMVAAPSVIRDKQTGLVKGQYTWLNDPWQSRHPVPAWIPQEIDRRRASKRPATATAVFLGQSEATDDEVYARVTQLADAVAAALEPGRNSLLFTESAKAFDYAAAGQISTDQVEFIFVQAGMACGLDESAVRATVASSRNRPHTPYVWKSQAAPVPPAITDPYPEAENQEQVEEDKATSRFLPGGTFILNVSADVPAVWGQGQKVLWAEGESLIIAAPQGTGKTTLACQLLRARIGLQDSVLGFPVARGKKKVLYLAMDRPRQFQRAANRIFKDDDEQYINDHLDVWVGPPPFDLSKRTDILVAMCERSGADTVIIDSVKDAAVGISNDEVGAGYSRSRGAAIAEGVEVLELHHNRKAGVNGAEPNSMADVYGSTWIPAGAGSVISLFGDPGDPVVRFRHLKQPMEEVGPFMVEHNHMAGTSSIHGEVSVFDLLRSCGVEGLTPKAAAKELFDTGVKAPSTAEVEKARRRLDQLVEDGLAVCRKSGTTKPSVYYLTPIVSS